MKTITFIGIAILLSYRCESLLNYINQNYRSCKITGINHDRYFNQLFKLASTSADTVTANVSTALPESSPQTAVFSESSIHYIMCSNCKTAYKYDMNGSAGRVKCSVCGKDWFQGKERVSKTDPATYLIDLSASKIAEVQRIISETNTPKYPRVDKIGLFVGNLPYEYTEQTIADLFAEYGVLNTALVKDEEGRSKGFGFVEVATQEDADNAIREMTGYYTSPSRKLIVRVQTNTKSGGPPRQYQNSGPRGDAAPRKPEVQSSTNSGTPTTTTSGAQKQWSKSPRPT